MGKTRLVQAVCDDAMAEGSTILWGRCVRFGAVNSPYGPFVRALEGWAESAEADELSEVLDAVPAASGLLPSLGGHALDSATPLLSLVDALVMAIAAHQPTVLVIDDVQWSDQASRDALSYLVAGLRAQRLAILATYRDEALDTGDPMHGWLADLKRLPSVTHLRLDRLTREETEQQVEILLDSRPSARLVDDVVRRSDGNPYLNELLLEGVGATAEQLPAELPTELTAALLAAWHRLAAPAREVMRLIAVAGRPTAIDDLQAVAAVRGIGVDVLTTALAEGTNAGISVAPTPDKCWFRHPLLAEVLYTTFVPGEAKAVHTSWVKVLEAHSRTGVDEVQRIGDLALHYEAAGEWRRCLDASLQAADLAKMMGASHEVAIHLHRAAGLWSKVASGRVDGVDQEIDLLERLAQANDLIGDREASFAAWSRALELVGEHADPLRASRLMRHKARAASATARLPQQAMPALVAEAQRAVELSQPFPDSVEYVEALAVLSWRHLWNEEFEIARLRADEAVRAAQRSGSEAAMSWALAARGMADPLDERSDLDTADALQFALAAGDLDLLWLALMARHSYLVDHGRLEECVETDIHFLPFALKSGALSVASMTTAILSTELMMLGRLSDSAEIIRQGLSLGDLGSARSMLRLAAASLSVRQGDLHTADLHLQRARELAPEFQYVGGARAVFAEYLIATGRPQQALDLVTQAIHSEVQLEDRRTVDEMLVWGARAAAVRIGAARDLGDNDGIRAVRAQLDDLVEFCKREDLPRFALGAPDDLVQPAMEALFMAETARCTSATPTSDIWYDAVRRCHAADLRWDEAVSSWQLAQALFAEGAARTVVAEPLRSAHRFAADAGAKPLLGETETLAALAKISLNEPAESSASDVPPRLRSLTNREREVLSHLAAGRTYSEIAKALYISEKTVSAHVSHLLHKTGTSSGRELAALALRLDQISTASQP